jgi:hypothetical protein
MTTTPLDSKESEEEHFERLGIVIASAIAKANVEGSSSTQNRYITLGQFILGIIGLVITIGVAGTGYLSTQDSKTNSILERMVKVEYQNQISIADRADLHSQIGIVNNTVNELNTHMARIDTNVQTLLDSQKSRNK